jgi:hypothetical protein
MSPWCAVEACRIADMIDGFFQQQQKRESNSSKTDKTRWFKDEERSRDNGKNFSI